MPSSQVNIAGAAGGAIVEDPPYLFVVVEEFTTRISWNGMKGFAQDIEGLAVRNDEFRRVLYTAKHCQLVVMALKPKEEIRAKIHELDQFFRVEERPVRRFSTVFGRRSERASR